MRIQRTVLGSGLRRKDLSPRVCSQRNDLRTAACLFHDRAVKGLVHDFPVVMAAKGDIITIFFFLPLSQVPPVVRSGYRTFAQYFRNRLPSQDLAPLLRCPVIPVKDREGAATIGFLLACCFKQGDFDLADMTSQRTYLETYFRQHVLPFFQTQNITNIFPLWAS